jgi:3-deoxy-manno-octulosonate cytidylyltransferase (CMP-KDO synthetase)
MTVADFKVVIPARYASVRLPGKALRQIAGKPMIAWVYERACRSGAAAVYVATDDERIASACRAIGAAVEMTAASHPSGSDRIAELATRLAWPDEQIVVNVQGDEPLLPPVLIDQVANLLARDSSADIATLMAPVRDEGEFADPNVVKIVVGRGGNALYFSRAPIPYPRDGGVPAEARRHVGLYAYRVGSLKALAESGDCALEGTERLEQLRALWLGQRIVIDDAIELPPRGVDTETDLAEARRIMDSNE